MLRCEKLRYIDDPQVEHSRIRTYNPIAISNSTLPSVLLHSTRFCGSLLDDVTGQTARSCTSNLNHNEDLNHAYNHHHARAIQRTSTDEIAEAVLHGASRRPSSRVQGWNGRAREGMKRTSRLHLARAGKQEGMRRTSAKNYRVLL